MSAKQYVRKITKKSNYSYSVIIPKELIDDFSWKDRQKIVIKSYGKNKLLISDWKPKKK